MERLPAAAATAAASAAEETMALYDACWFRRCVLLPSPNPPLAPAPEQQSSPPPERAVDIEPQEQVVISSSSSATTSSGSPSAGPRHRRTRSDEFQQGLEPLRVPTNRARLETILSGKDGMVAAPLPERATRRTVVSHRRRPRRQRRGRSMSELEFEELQGLQDLGFVFTNAEVGAELASIVPGLRRLRSGEVVDLPLAATASAPPAVAAPSSSSARQEEAEAAAAAVPNDSAAAAPRRRPYLSEAWDDEEEEVRAMLRNWRIPPAGDGADLKEHLRMWAHTVASAVR